MTTVADVPTYEEVVELAKDVQSGHSRSYVQAAMRMAAFLLHEANTRVERRATEVAIDQTIADEIYALIDARVSGMSDTEIDRQVTVLSTDQRNGDRLAAIACGRLRQEYDRRHLALDP